MLPVGVPTVDPSLVDAVAASPERVAWWEERLAAVRGVREAGRS
jgi:O-succinylbenzoate synthase